MGKTLAFCTQFPIHLRHVTKVKLQSLAAMATKDCCQAIKEIWRESRRSQPCPSPHGKYEYEHLERFWLTSQLQRQEFSFLVLSQIPSLNKNSEICFQPQFPPTGLYHSLWENPAILVPQICLAKCAILWDTPKPWSLTDAVPGLPSPALTKRTLPPPHSCADFIANASVRSQY